MAENQTKPFFKSIAGQTLIAVLLGIIAGIFFGEKCSILRPIGEIYSSFLQVVVFPFIISVLISGLGKLAPQVTYNLLKRGWKLYLTLLAVSFALIGLLTLAIPQTVSLQGAVAKHPAGDLVPLLFSSNIFNALSQNHLPAVIIFCTILGLVMQRMKQTRELFHVLDTISHACLELWRVMIWFAPYAVFIFIADTAGTIKLNQLAGAGIYLFLFYLGTFMLAFWIFPVLICSFLPISYKELMLKMREPLIIAATTTHAVLALPYIHNIVIDFLRHHGKMKERERIEPISDTNMVVSYSFAHAGNFFIYLFMVFAALYFNNPISTSQKIWLPFLSFFSSIGPQSATISAVTFLSEWMHLPKEATNLYISLLPLLTYNEVIVSVMAIAFFTLVITWAYFHPVRLKNPLKLIGHLAAACLLLLTVAQLKHWVPDAAKMAYVRILNSDISREITAGVNVKFSPPLDEKSLKKEKNSEESLYRIERTGVLRVGYTAHQIPFSFYNKQRQLVGYDIALMYELARALKVNIEFIPYTLDNLVSDMEADAFDIAVGGLYITPSRLIHVAYTQPYMETTPAFIVPLESEAKFQSVETIQQMPHLKIGLFPSSILEELIKTKFPHAEIITIADADCDIAFEKYKLDALLWNAASARLWVLGRPNYAVAAPKEIAVPLLIGFMLMQQASEFQDFLNFWLLLKEKEGVKEQLYNYWILALPKPESKPRWSIIQNLWGKQNE